MSALDDALLDAHAKGDAAALVDLYQKAAAATVNPEQAAFYLTHAHVFALETGHPDTARLRNALIKEGRESPLLPAKPKVK